MAQFTALQRRAPSTLQATLIDTREGIPKSIPIRCNFASQKSVTGTVAIGELVWTPETAETLSVDLDPFSVTDSAANAQYNLTPFAAPGGDPLVSFNCDYIEFALVGDPLAVDSYGNPIAASRATNLTAQVYNGATLLHSAVLSVTEAGKASIFRVCTTSSVPVNLIQITGVTATAAKLYIHFGGVAGT